MALLLVVGIVIFLIGAVVGTIVRFKRFLVGSMLVGALWAILSIFRAHGFYEIVMGFTMAVMFVILMLVGAAIGRTLKQAFLEDAPKGREDKVPV